MNQYAASMRRYLQYTLFLLVVFVLGWGFSDYQPIFLGLILGTCLSLYNLWNMHSKVKRLGTAITEGKKVYSLGTLSRLFTAGLAVLIALRFPETLHLLSVVIGLMTAYIIILIDSLLQIKRL